MPNYAIYDGHLVSNVIVADTQEIAEQVTGLSALEVVDGQPWIDWTLIDGVWIEPVTVKPEVTDE